MTQAFLIPHFDSKIEIFSLNTDRFVIGRESDCNFIIKDTVISRYHAIILYDKSDFLLVDNESSNGVYVNEVKVVEQRLLKHGDTIRIGSYVFEFSCNLPEKVEFFEGWFELIPDAVENRETLIDYLVKEKILFSRLSDKLLKEKTIRDMFSSILHVALEILKAENGILLIKEGAGLQPAISVNIENEFQGVNTLSSSIVSFVKKNGNPIIVNNPVFNYRFTGMSLLQLQIESAVCSPICLGDKVLGVLYVDNRQGGQFFDSYQYALFLSFIRHCEKLLLNAHSVEKMVERIKIRNEETRWEELFKLKDDVMEKLSENILKPLNQLGREIGSKNEINQNDLKKIQEFYSKLVNRAQAFDFPVESKSTSLEKTVNINEVIADIVSEVEYYATSSDIDFRISGTVLVLKLDRFKIMQVLRNLVLFILNNLRQKGVMDVSFEDSVTVKKIMLQGRSDHGGLQIDPDEKLFQLCNSVLAECGGELISRFTESTIAFEMMFKLTGTVRVEDTVEDIPDTLVSSLSEQVCIVTNINEFPGSELYESLNELDDISIKHYKGDISGPSDSMFLFIIDEDNFDKIRDSIFKAALSNSLYLFFYKNTSRRMSELKKDFLMFEFSESSRGDEILECIRGLVQVMKVYFEWINREKLDVIKDISATLQHELNNPMQILTMNMDIVEENFGKSGRIERMRENVTRISQVLENFKNISDYDMISYSKSRRNIIQVKNSTSSED